MLNTTKNFGVRYHHLYPGGCQQMYKNVMPGPLQLHLHFFWVCAASVYQTDHDNTKQKKEFITHIEDYRLLTNILLHVASLRTSRVICLFNKTREDMSVSDMALRSIPLHTFSTTHFDVAWCTHYRGLIRLCPAFRGKNGSATDKFYLARLILSYSSMRIVCYRKSLPHATSKWVVLHWFNRSTICQQPGKKLHSYVDVWYFFAACRHIGSTDAVRYNLRKKIKKPFFFSFQDLKKLSCDRPTRQNPMGIYKSAIKWNNYNKDFAQFYQCWHTFTFQQS